MKPIRLIAASSLAIILLFFIFSACQKSTKHSLSTAQSSPDPSAVRSWFENTAISNENAAVAAGKKALVKGAPLVQHARLAGIDKLIDWDNGRSYRSGGTDYLVMPFNEPIHPFVNKNYEAARAIVFYPGANNTHQFKIVEAVSDKGGHLNADIRDVAAAAVGKAAQPVAGFNAHVIVYNRYYFQEAMYTYSNGSRGPGTMSIGIVPKSASSSASSSISSTSSISGSAGGAKTAMSTKVPMGTCAGSAGCTEEDTFVLWYGPGGTNLDFTGPYYDCSGSGYGGGLPPQGYTLPTPPPPPYNSCDLASSLAQNSNFNTAFNNLGNELNAGYESAFFMNAQGIPQAQMNGGYFGENFLWGAGSFNNTTGYVFNHEWEGGIYSTLFNWTDMSYLATIFTGSTIAGSPNGYTFATVTPAGSYLLVITDYTAFQNFAWAFNSSVNPSSNYNLWTAFSYYVNTYNSDATNEVNFLAFLNYVSGGTGLTLMKMYNGTWQTVSYDSNGQPLYTPC